MEDKIIHKALPYLTFRLGDESYAIEIEKSREVLNYTKITRIPKTPEYMLGVINLRGGVVPVVDLKMKFGMEKIMEPAKSKIIILELLLNKETLLIGALVDSVQEVLELENNHIESAPKLGMNMNTEFIKGIGKKGEEFLIILDIDKIFSVSELTLVSGLKKSDAPEPV